MAEIQWTTQEQIDEMTRALEKALQRAEEYEKLEKKYRGAGAGVPGRQSPAGPAPEGSPPERGRRKRAKILSLTGNMLFYGAVAALVFVLASVLYTKARGEVPNLLGYQLYTVQSGSMEPTLRVGAVIVSKTPADPAALTVGDVVTFRTGGGAVVTHRVIQRLEDSGGIQYRTKGDNPVKSPDPELLTPDRVLAIFLFKVPLT